MSILNVNKINPVGGGSTITIAGIASVTSSISIASSCTATTYYGDGSQLTGAGPTLTNGADNRVITATGANALNAESGFTFDGTDVQVPDKINLNTSGSSIKSNQLRFQSGGAAYIDQYNTSQSINIRMSSSSALDTTAMTINHNGHITKPAHPCFDVVRSGGHVTSGNYIIYNTVHVNNGAHYNASTGKFTAPVAGHYFFSYGTIKNTSAVTRIYIRKNGSNVPSGADRHLRMDSGTGYGDNGAMTIVLNLAVGDEIQIYVGAGEAYGTTQEYCYFNGYLIG